jgi:hypothetical protein
MRQLATVEMQLTLVSGGRVETVDLSRRLANNVVNGLDGLADSLRVSNVRQVAARGGSG